ncbi:ABC transporter permease [Listeria sp. FSL L8-0308]|uniref:FtsX-like permease family protein n=1 Tax=Paenibacillus TaxID=44249 RepID=UPI0013EC2C80|nr:MULTISPECIES: ABC transporter permease [Paenibacillus]KAF6576889.1 ABC transporter permease [Paenibacillus sp. EKM206P]KAF6590924.1 ABC transporter permease [Paenibacillus sp. EKM205P]
MLNLLIDSLKQHKRKTILSILQCTASYILVILTLSLATHTHELASNVQNATSSLYKVNDNFFNDEEKNFLAQSDNLKVLNELYEWEKTNPSFKYIIASRQNLFLDVQGLPAKFQYGYEAGHETPDAYESIQVNQQFIDHFAIQTSEGRLFQAGDYNVKNDVIPIILGYEYKDYFKLKQIIHVGYMGVNLKCKVIGFLGQHSFYNNGYALKYLDKLVVFPSLEVDNIHAQDRSFMLKLFLDKTSGYIQSSLSAQKIQDLFTQKSLQLDVEPYVVEGVSNFYLTMWGLEGEQLQKVLFIFSFVIAFVSLFSISTNLIAKITLRKYTYGIMIANGTRRAVINLSILFEIFFVNLVSLCIAALFSFMISQNINIPILLIFSFTLSLLSFIPPCISVNRIKLSKTIRGGN